MDVSSALFLVDYQDELSLKRLANTETYIVELAPIHIVLERFDQLLQLIPREVINIWLSVWK